MSEPLDARPVIARDKGNGPRHFHEEVTIHEPRMSGKAKKNVKDRIKEAGRTLSPGGRLKGVAMFLSSVLLSFCLLGEPRGRKA